jgi:hypothetical protein
VETVEHGVALEEVDDEEHEFFSRDANLRNMSQNFFFGPIQTYILQYFLAANFNTLVYSSRMRPEATQASLLQHLNQRVSSSLTSKNEPNEILLVSQNYTSFSIRILNFAVKKLYRTDTWRRDDVNGTGMQLFD